MVETRASVREREREREREGETKQERTKEGKAKKCVRKFETGLERDEGCTDETKTATTVARVANALVDRERERERREAIRGLLRRETWNGVVRAAKRERNGRGEAENCREREGKEARKN